MASPTQAPVRCIRCGTILRNNRTHCPSCGREVSEAAAGPAAGGSAAVTVQLKAPVLPKPSSGASAADPAALPKRPGVEVGKVKKKICPICLVTVEEEKMLEINMQKVCPTCHDLMAARIKELKDADSGEPPAGN